MGVLSTTFVGPFAEWRIRGKRPLCEIEHALNEGNSYFRLSSTGISTFCAFERRVKYERYILMPWYDGPGRTKKFPRRMWESRLLFGEGVIEAEGGRVTLGKQFGAAAYLGLEGVDADAEIAWLRAMYDKLFQRLTAHYEQTPRFAWGMIGDLS